MQVVPVKSQHLDAAEVAWFAPLCSDDYRYLGVPDGSLRSSWENTYAVAKLADKLGYRNILCPSSYQVGQDTLSFVAAMAPLTQRMNFLAAIRCGEMQPIMLARTVATLDHMLKGRLILNVISSDFPGETASNEHRYQRSKEVVEILKQAWTQDEINYQGQVYQFKGLTTDPVRPYQTGGPLLYFGGYSPQAVDLCAQHCDVYLMWPETEEELAGRMRVVHERAQHYGRVIDYGLRVHMVVRDTEQEAREYAAELVSQLDDDVGRKIRERALDGLHRTPPVDRRGPGPLGLRCGASGQRGPGAEQDRALPKNGHPRLHLLGLPAPAGVRDFRHQGAAAVEDLLPARDVWPRTPRRAGDAAGAGA